MIRILLILAISLTFVSCKEDVIDAINNNDVTFLKGTDESLDIATWNLKEFPLDNQTTLDHIKQVMDTINVDIIAMQEIIDNSYFLNLVNQLSGWNGYRANSASFDMNLAYIYNTYFITAKQFYEIEDIGDTNFVRQPLVMEFTFDSKDFVIINTHLKAYTEEPDIQRRREACGGLKLFCDTNYPAENLFIVGDMNDAITDSDEENVFTVFLDDPFNYSFADADFAGDSGEASYIPLLSHIDHIIISNELYDEFSLTGSKSQTIKAEYILGNSNQYQQEVSDHRPVGIKIAFE